MELVEAPASGAAVDAELAGGGPDRAGEVGLVHQFWQVDPGPRRTAAPQRDASRCQPCPDGSYAEVLGQLPQQCPSLVATRKFFDRKVETARHLVSMRVCPGCALAP